MRDWLLILFVAFFAPLHGFNTSSSELDSLHALLLENRIDNYTEEDLISLCIKYSNVNAEKSNDFCEYVILEAKFQENVRVQAKANLELGMNLNSQGDHNNAYQYLLKGFQIAQELENKRLIFDSYLKLGVFHNDRGNNVLAIQNYLLGLEMSAEMNDTLLMVRPYVNLTSTYLDQNRPEKAIEYGLKGLELAKLSGEKRGEGYLLNNLALAYLEKGDAKEAKKFLIEALRINEEGKRPIRIARNHSNLCKTYSLLGNMSKAKEHCEIAERILTEHENPRSKALHAIQYGDYYFAAKDYVNAEIQATKAIQLGKQNAMTVQIAPAYELLYELQKISGEERQALKSYEKYVELKYGKDITRRNAQIATLEDEYLNTLNEKKKIQSEAERKLIEQERKLTQSQRNLAFILASLLIALAFLLYNRYNAELKTNKLLQDRNQKIQSQSLLIQESLSEKETLLKEIHHRVKNNLQTISSLLNLQSKKITDESVLDSINEGKNRVEAMSLIHQNLYQTDNLTTIGMQKYFVKLLSHLSHSFREEEKEISYSIDAEDIYLDVDTAIPIGLIANELISNAYKHAFSERTKGHIDIALLDKGDDQYRFSISDNGKGIEEDININKIKSLGLKLVRSLGVKQLKGKFKIENDNGTRMILLFTHQNKMKRP